MPQARYRPIDTRMSGCSQGDAFHFHGMNSRAAKTLHIWAAAIGAAAFLVIGLLSALLTSGNIATPMADNTTMQIGVTTTLEPTPPTAPGVTRAVPAIRGPAK